MPLKVLIALLTLIAAPLLLLGWVSASTMRADRSTAQRQIEAVLRSRLKEIDTSVQPLFDEIATMLTSQVRLAIDQDAASGDLQHGELARFQRGQPLVQRAIIVNPRGMMIYPPPPPNNSQSDRIEEYAALKTLAMSRPRRASEDSSVQAISVDQSKAAAQQASAQPSRLSAPVYHIWYRDEGTQLSLWWYQESGSAIGVMLARSRWMAELMTRLPNTPLPIIQVAAQSIYKNLSGERRPTPDPVEAIALYDESNRLVYRWGDDIDLSKTPETQLELSEPLSSWNLKYYAARPLTNPVRFTGLYAAITGLGIVLFALGAYVLTNLQRQIRLAKNRVTFAGQVSHELRTPLTNIRLYTELAQADLQSTDNTTSERIAARLAIIDGESRRLSRLVSGVMEVIREDEGKRPLRLLAQNADKVIDDVIEQFLPSYEAASIRIERHRGANQSIVFDADCLDVILVNLLSNIEKYAAAGGLAKIESFLRSDNLCVRVCDHGPGIASRHHQHVFKAFRRLDDSISAPSGTGIGLTIARRLARRHGGDVKIVPSTKGVCFEVTIRVSLENA
jgi:signal transduction histidine kinase